MVAPSKMFEWPLNRSHCSQIWHSLPNQTCTQAFIWSLYRNNVSSAQFYSPLVLLPLLTQWRHLTWNKVLNAIKHFGLTATFASSINALTFYLMCVSRNLNGRFVWGQVPFLSCWLGSQLCWLMPSSVLQVYFTGTAHAALEALLRQGNVGLVHSRAQQTLIFMLCSMVVMREQQAQRYKGFWFIKPKTLPANYEKLALAERLSTTLWELRAYLAVGLAVDAFNVLPNFKLERFRLKSTSFMCSYFGIFKLTQCLLAGSLELKHVNLLAAFLGGSAYGLLNRLSLMSFAVVIASQVLWLKFCSRDAAKSKFITFLQKIPFSKLLIPWNLAYLVQCLFFQQHLVNSLARSFIDRTSDRNAIRVVNFLTKPNMEDLLNNIKKLPEMPFI